MNIKTPDGKPKLELSSYEEAGFHRSCATLDLVANQMYFPDEAQQASKAKEIIDGLLEKFGGNSKEAKRLKAALAAAQ